MSNEDHASGPDQPGESRTAVSGHAEHTRRLLNLISKPQEGGDPADLTGLAREVQKWLQEERRITDEAEHRYRTLFDAAPDSIMVVQDGHYTLANPAAARLLGYGSPEELAQVPVLDTIHPDDRASIVEQMRGVSEGRANERMRLRLLRKDGSTIISESLSVPISIDGRPAAFVLGHDITQAHETRRLLEESEDRLRSLFENAPSFITLVDRSGKVLSINRTVAGLRPASVVGRSVYDFIEPEHRVLARECIERVFASGAPAYYHSSAAGPNGIAAWYDNYLGPVRRGEEITAVSIFGIDVTKRVLTQISEERLRQERQMTTELLLLAGQTDRLRDLMKAATGLFRQWSQCEAVGIRLREGHDFPYYETSGFPAQFVRLENSLCAHDQEGELVRDSEGNPALECMCGNVICGRFDPDLPFFTPGGSFWTNSTSELLASTSESDRQASTRNMCNGMGYESVALVPLRSAGETFGLVQFNDRQKGRFTLDEISLYERLASSLALGVAQRRAAHELSESEDKYKTLVEHSRQGVLIIDEGGIAFANQATANLIGYSVEELMSLQSEDLPKLFHPEDGPVLLGRMRNRLAGRSEPSRYEFRIVRKDGQVRWLEQEVCAIEYRGKPAVQSFAVDITERRQTEQALRESEERLRLALKSTNDVVWDWDVIRDTQKWNDAGTVVFGWTDIVAHPQTASWWVDRVHPDDRERVDKSFFEVVNDPKLDFWYDEYRFLKADGSYAEVMDRGYVLRDEHGRAVRMIGAMLDITERKRAEQALNESRRELELTLEATTDGIWTWDFENNRLTFSRRYYEMLGYEPGEFPATFESWQDLIHPEDRTRALATAASYLESKVDLYENEFRLRCKDGSYRWIRAKARVVERDADGRAIRMIGNHEDITERQQAVETVRASERFAQAIAATTPAITYIYDVVRQANTWINATAKEFLGPINDTSMDGISLLVHPADWDSLARRLAELRACPDGAWRSVEYRFKTRDGQWRWLHDRASVFERGSDDELISIIGSAIDITERRKAEEDLRRSQRTLRALVDASPYSTFLMDPDGRVVECNEVLAEVFGVSRQAIIGSVAYDGVPPEVAERRRRKVHEVLETRKPVRFTDQRGDRTIDNSIHPILDADGNVVQLVIHGCDITALKESEEALRRSEASYRSLAESSPNKIFVSDAEGKSLYYNARSLEYLGLDESEASGFDWLEPIHPEDRREVEKAFRKALKAGSRSEVEYRLRRAADGAYRWHLAVGVPMKDDSGDIVRWFGTCMDIHDHKEAECALTEANRRLEEEKQLLNDKNVALRELTGQVRDWKDDISQQLQANIDKILMPLLAKIELHANDRGREYVQLLRSNLEDVASPFYSRLASLYATLTPREVEVCNMIRHGMSSKEMASALSVSVNTIFNQRRSIRKKLKIAETDANLATLLRSLADQ